MDLIKLLAYTFTIFFRLPPIARLIIVLVFITQSIYFSILSFRFTTLWYGKLIRKRNKSNRFKLLENISNQSQKTIIGFFHPYCNAGGGGERVLWTAVAFHQRNHSNVICAIYTGDLGVTKEEMISKVKQRFNIDIELQSLILVPLTSRYLLEASYWPRFTLLGQSLGSIVVGFEAINRLIPDVYIDTMGYAFTYPIFSSLAGIPIGAYVHYPTISTDMVKKVTNRQSAHNHSSIISNSFILTHAKLLYYILFAELYSNCLKQADNIMVNSTWTKRHIENLLKPSFYQSTINSNSKKEIEIIYPPCDIKSFINFPLSSRHPIILSISQFRPEKDQIKQILSFSNFLKLNPNKPFKLILAGSCRDSEDEKRVEDLKKLVDQLGLQSKVEFKVNIDYNELKHLLSISSIGLSTMVDEHFGISIVEFMASGLIPLVHASGGPLTDIIEEKVTGYFGTTIESYSQQLNEITSTDQIQLETLRENARKISQEKFSEEVFEFEWDKVWNQLKDQKRGLKEELDKSWIPKSRLLGNESKKVD
ncbi:hypothetical protein CROQUDRAFT_719448 [Cronartium quercuum f. sp. fusiforme G11]|uniref:GDP-Man:Man(3)GlcNAc(2)-PP-Dol alpha-1,2-mannosyltransferase n=1 Tax=Cronartium quercuum f. sp. fusiforme G11 TaxID=708437 RepID=A0A9P6NZ99_9BASI|nr:hypothetical protein CROQUDRAFT_719448 [Cronartium quercuum f. sp. fusiforme G11]